MGLRGNSGGPRDGDAPGLLGGNDPACWQPFGDGAGSGGGEATGGRSFTVVEPMERWAAAVHMALGARGSEVA